MSVSLITITRAPRALLRPAVWSNCVFLAPLALAFLFQNAALFLVITVVFVFSTLYHFVSEKPEGLLLDLDTIAAGLLILFNAGLVGFGRFTPPYVYWVFVFVGIALYFFQRSEVSWRGDDTARYELYHSLWHFSAAMITILSTYTYYF